MSRGGLIIFSLIVSGLLGCDTTSNVQPRNEDFFIKFYAGVSAGNQFANDIITTSDGGLLITGRSENNDGTQELIVIKTDAKGNQEWIFGALQDIQGEASEGKSVIELQDGYVVGGVKNDGVFDRSVLLKLDLAGNLISGPIVITTIDPDLTEHFNNLSKVTLGQSGDLLVSGITDHPSGSGGTKDNVFIKLYNPDLTSKPAAGGFDVLYVGGDGNDKTVGAFEINDYNNVNSDSIRYLIFGHTDVSADNDFYYVGVTRNFSPTDSKRDSTSGDQIASYVARFDDEYWVVGKSGINNPQIFLVGWEFQPNPDPTNGEPPFLWRPNRSENIVTTTEKVEGKGVAVQSDGQFILASDIIYTVDEYSEIHIARVGKNDRSIKSPWPKIFGTTAATYTACAVTVLTDGSIVTVGTADLQPIKKIIVIKTGPDGQMSF